MPSLLRLCMRLSLVSLPLALAKDAPNYDPASNLHPRNVSGLTGLYKWVGSYYNATTEIDVTPRMTIDSNDSLCENLWNKTITKTYNESVLAITERGPKNQGPNPVNLWLSIIPPSFNWSGLPTLSLWKDAISDWELLWPLMSTDPFVYDPLHRETADDTFNMTASRPDLSTFALSGTVHGNPGKASEISRAIEDFPMDHCKDISEAGSWRIYLYSTPVLGISDTKSASSLKYPTMNASFDGRTANLTVNGKFLAYGPHANWRKGLTGDIRIRFRGVLDAYHSDVLDVNSSTPVWLRTVGFGNNSLNIDNDASNAAGRFGVGLGGASVTVLSVLMGMMLSA